MLFMQYSVVLQICMYPVSYLPFIFFSVSQNSVKWLLHDHIWCVNFSLPVIVLPV